MSAPAIEPPPDLPPLERHGQIEVDAFCIGCFYNLHGQVVTIDPRLGFPICRCPECGRFQPAGAGVTSSRVWLRRFASILLFAWVVIIGLLTFGFSAIMLGFDASAIGLFAVGESIPIASHQWRYQIHLTPWNVPTTPDYSGLSTMLYISAGSITTGFIAAALCVTLLWHWKRPRYLWTIILPLLPVLILAVIFHESPEYEGIRIQCMQRVLCQAGIQSVGILIGVFLGRMLARGVVRMFIPPRPRQFLAFLWLVDGKNPPPPGE
jgi:hypothetical protein